MVPEAVVACSNFEKVQEKSLYSKVYVGEPSIRSITPAPNTADASPHVEHTLNWPLPHIPDYTIRNIILTTLSEI